MRYSAPGFFFTQISPVRIGDLGSRPKIQNFDGLGLKTYPERLYGTTIARIQEIEIHTGIFVIFIP
jgi:hypothetical protein